MTLSTRIRSYALDFYVAFLVFVIGAYGILDSHWPPVDIEPWVAIILIVEDIYLVIASLAVMIAMFLRKSPRHAACSIVTEAFGWMFIGVAAAVIALTSFQIPPAVFVDPHPEDGLHWIHYTWIFIWSGLAVAALAKCCELRRFTKRGIVVE